MQPKIYKAEEHKIAPDKIDSHVHLVIQKLREAGHKAYLVGGGVRDLLLGERPKDFDVSTSAKPEEVRSLFRNAILIGRRFRLAHIRFGKKIIEVSTFRAGATEEAGLIVRDNEWGTEEQDVLRRDFTINGLFYDPESQEVIDYVDGYPDIEKRILRAIGQPDVRFTQDPVRMIRLIKFCARFNFEIHKPTFEALLLCKGEITKSSPARIFEELLRMLESGSAKPFFHLLHEYGILKPLSPNLAKFFEEEVNPALHMLAVVDDEVKKNQGEPVDRSLLLATLLFPLFSKRLVDQNRHLHLGEIADTAHKTIDHVFNPFFNIPRRMRAQIGFLLSTQYRFIPLDGRQVKRPRAPKDPLFSLALHLLKIRSSIQPELLPHYTLWTETAFNAHASTPLELSPKRKRRRRRKRGPRESSE